MSRSLIDLSDRAALKWHAHVVGAVQQPLADQDFFVAGAQAREILLTHQHGIDGGRATLDIDFAVMVENWDQFEQLRQRLIATGKFSARPNLPRRLHFGSIPVDIIPFGAVEHSNRTIAWPPDGVVVTNTLGFQESLAQCEWVRLPGGVEVRVASIPAQALMKLIAWAQQNRDRGSKDAQDIRTLARAYGAIEKERLFSQTELFERPDFDADAAGAWLLGLDAARGAANTANPDSRLLDNAQTILTREVDPKGKLTLVSSMGGNSIDENMKLVSWFRDGVVAGRK